MSRAPTPDLAALMADCALGAELHRLAVERVQKLARLLALGKTMQEVAGVVLHRLCDDDATDARQYMQALQEVIVSDLNVLAMYVSLQSREPLTPKA